MSTSIVISPAGNDLPGTDFASSCGASKGCTLESWWGAGGPTSRLRYSGSLLLLVSLLLPAIQRNDG